MWTNERLDELLRTPPDRLIEELDAMQGDFIILGASGKIGPSLAIMLKRALDEAGREAKVYAVSRFRRSEALSELEAEGVIPIRCDLMQRAEVEALPKVKHVIYIASSRYDAMDDPGPTWSFGTVAPLHVCEHFTGSDIVVLSSGAVYPPLPVISGGATEEIVPAPKGDYAMANVAKEHIFRYFVKQGKIRAVILRLSYAVNLRHGVLLDIAKNILDRRPVSRQIPMFNCVWQGYANEIMIRSLALLDDSDPYILLNVTGPETASVAEVASLMAHYLNRPFELDGDPEPLMILNNAGYCFSRFGYPTIALDTMIRWQAEWLQAMGGGEHGA